MNKTYLNFLIISAMGSTLSGCASAPPFNPYSVEPNRWEKQLSSSEVDLEDRFIPVYAVRSGVRQIIAVDRFDLRLNNRSNQYQCIGLRIDDKLRPSVNRPHHSVPLQLVAPKQIKNIGSYSPRENDEGFSIDYRLRSGTVQQTGKDYRCVEKNSASSSQDDDCYITTAMCRDTGKADDCEELQTLRRYRDDVMLHDPEGRTLVKHYYEKAPKIVALINAQPNHHEIYRHLRQDYIQPAAEAARLGQNDLALQLYKQMVENLAAEYL